MKTLLKSTALVLSLALAGPALAQDATAEQSVERVAAAPATPAMWKIADEDTTIYLFGTVHALPKDIDWYRGPVKDAIDSADVLVTEIDMTPESTAQMGPMIAAKGTLPEGQTLRGLMNDEQRTAYEAGLAKMGIPPEALDQLEPWLAAISLTQVIAQAAGATPEGGTETVLEATIGADTERDALETVDYQIAVFDELPVEDQIAFLLAGLEDPQAAVALLGQMIEEWKVGNVEQLAEMLKESAEESPTLTQRLFYTRNQNWAVWIDDRLDAPGTVFLAVGAGHLAGAKSVQDYLAERGIAVTRVQ